MNDNTISFAHVEKLHQEYMGLNFDFSKLSDGQESYSQLLLYYLIKPLVKEQIFNKKILDCVNANSHLKIIAPHNNASMVQASIYQRLIIKESVTAPILGDKLKEELPALIDLCELGFLPWWKIRLKNPELCELVKLARKISFWSNKIYFYYLIQKIA